MQVNIFLITVFGLCLAAGTHIHDKIDHVFEAKAALLHKVHAVKSKKVEFVKNVSQKAIDTAVAAKEKKLALVKGLLHKKEVHQPEINVAYKVHKYHGVKVTPVIHTVEHSHIHVAAPVHTHNTFHSETPYSYHSETPYSYQAVSSAQVHSHNSYHSESPHSHSYHQGVSTAEVHVPAQPPVYTQVVHEPIQVSHVEPAAYTEWKKQEWVPTTVPDQIVIQKKGLISKLKDIHAVKKSWKPQIHVIKSHESHEVQPVVQESWSSASYPSHESSGSYWQQEAAPAPVAEWSPSSDEHTHSHSQWPTSAHAHTPSHESSYAVEFSVNHPGHSTSHQAIEQNYPHAPVVAYSETDGHYQSHHGQPLRNSYGEIVSGDVGFSASENAEVSVVAPKSNAQEDEIEAPIEPKESVQSLDNEHHEAEPIELKSSPSNSTTTV